MRGGEEVKISKRAGSYVTVRDLIDWVGRDAVRFFLVSRKADSEFVFDVDLALREERGKPGVLRAVRARARLQRVRASGAATRRGLRSADLEPADRREGTRARAAARANIPRCVAAAAQELAPHAIAFYLRELAGEFHSYYNAERILVEDEALARGAARAVRGGAPDARQRPRAPRRQRAGENVMRKTAERPLRASRSGGSFLLGMFVGLVLGLAIALGVAFYLNKTPLPFLGKPKPRRRRTRAKPAKPRRSPACRRARANRAPTRKPKFDFYKILPGSEEPVTEKELKAARRARPRQGSTGSRQGRLFHPGGLVPEPGRRRQPEGARSRSSASSRASSRPPCPTREPGTACGMGPYTKLDDLNRVRQVLSQNGIDASLVKIKEPPPRTTRRRTA